MMMAPGSGRTRTYATGRAPMLGPRPRGPSGETQEPLEQMLITRLAVSWQRALAGIGANWSADTCALVRVAAAV
jgi:hypothetical protein